MDTATISSSTSTRTPMASREEPESTLNIGPKERMFSVLAGAALAAAGLKSRGLQALGLVAAGGALVYRGVQGHCGLYEKLGINRAAATPQDYSSHGVQVKQAFTINKPADELYKFWRQLTTLPQFMTHLESVSVLSDTRSRWVAKAPRLVGGSIGWDAEIINDEPNALIAWRSLPGSRVQNAGSVRFVKGPGDVGTEVHVVIEYLPPGGQAGRYLAKIFGEEPQQQIKDDLRNFKRMMEAGEICTTQGQPRGNCSGGGQRQQGW